MDALDLFGQIPISREELTLWVIAVAPHYARSRRSLDHYIRHWDVATKVARAKADGSYAAISAAARAEIARTAQLLEQAKLTPETTTGA